MENKEIPLPAEIDIDHEEIEIIGIHTLCRLCANQNERLIGVFSEEGITNDLANKINLYLPVKVSVNDELPLQCCWNCASTLLAWHELVLTSVESDRKFRNSQLLTEKQIIDESIYEGTEDAHSEDNNGMEAEPITTSLNDFCKTEPIQDVDVVVSRKSPKSPKKKKKADIITCYAPQETSTPLETYMSDIEHHLIDPDLVDNSELSEYKIDIDQGHMTTEDDPKLDEIKDFENEITIKDDNEDTNTYFACQYCTAIFILKKDVITHIQTDHDKDCDPNCFEEVPKQIEERTAKKERRKHNKIDQEMISAAKVVVDGRIYYNCKECGKCLHSPYTYVWHMRIHTGERPYVCDLCGKQFRVSQGLVRHLRETHQGIKKFPCDLCGRMFTTRRNVEEHRRIHTNERPYVCDLCGKSFKQKASLFVHKRSHRNHFPFKCTYCNQGFRTKPPLMVHITRHTGEKPYKCEICGRCFRIKYELKRHRLIHSDEKPWICNICGLSFRQKRYLRNHTKSNHTLVAG